MSGLREESCCFFTIRKTGVEAWAETDPNGAEHASVDIVEIVPMPFRFTLKPPAATAEAINPAGGDFPWLGLLPGSRFRSSDYEVHSVVGYGFSGQDHTACSVT